MVSTLDRQSRLRGGREFEEEAVFDRDAAAEHHRRSYAWPRFEQFDPGHSREARADAGIRSAVASGNGPRWHWNADRGRTLAQEKRRHWPPRSRPREISSACARMAGQTRRHHY